MLLAIDIGNTHIVSGIFDEEGTLLASFRIASDDKLTEDMYFSYLKNIADFRGLGIDRIDGVIISSVVPALIVVFRFLSRRYFEIEPIIVGLELKLPFSFTPSIEVQSLGADRIINMAQISLQYPEYHEKNIVVFDLGTATTYDVLSSNHYIGGGIMPGIEMSINALFGSTAKLPKVKFSTPKSVIGKNTTEQIQAGIFYGYAGQIKNIIARIKDELPSPYLVATGGLGRVLCKEIEEIDIYSPELSIKGLFNLYVMNRG